MEAARIESILETEEAYFVFKMVRTNRKVYVAALNPYAVICLERLATRNNSLPKHYKLHSVMSTRAGTKETYPGIPEIPFPDFVLDIVTRQELYDDIIAYQTFIHGLSEDQYDYVKAKLQAEIDNEGQDESSEEEDDVEEDKEQSIIRTKHAVVIPKKALVTPSIPEGDDEEEDENPVRTKPSDTAMAALVSLGFKRKAVEKWASEFDASKKTVSEVIKDGCRMLAGQKS
jgi:RuvA, C-terminal domain